MRKYISGLPFWQGLYFQIGLGDFVPGTQIGKNTDDGERQANQMKLYVSFLYLLGQNTFRAWCLLCCRTSNKFYHHFSWPWGGQHELLPSQGGSDHEDEPSQEENDGAESQDKVFYS